MSSLADVSSQLNKVELQGMDHRTDDLLNSSNILNKDVNISIWERKLSNQILNSSQTILKENPELHYMFS